MNEFGKYLVIFGLILAVAGALIWSGVGRSWFGQLPGDIRYTNPRGNFSFYFPIVTCVLLSVVITILLWLIRK